jgi:exonuclease III
VTDHGAFVLFNVYVPNAGDRPERARLAAKLSFLTALRERVEDLLGAGRQVRFRSHSLWALDQG